MPFCGAIGKDCFFNGTDKEPTDEQLCCHADRACCYDCDDRLSCEVFNRIIESKKKVIADIEKISDDQITKIILRKEQLHIFLESIIVTDDFLTDGIDDDDKGETELVELAEEYDLDDFSSDLLDLFLKASLKFVSVIFEDEEGNLFKIDDHKLYVLFDNCEDPSVRDVVDKIRDLL